MKYAVVDFRISEEEMKNLINFGYKLLLCPPSNLLYDAVCGHPDMLMHIIEKNQVVVHRDMPFDFIEKLKGTGINVSLSKSSLTDSYPEDIILNALTISNLFVHNIKHTDENLLNYIKSKKLIQVKQGYTKCSTAVVSNTAAITSDKTIAKALTKEDIDVLLLPPGDILLPGLNYGFIGGCCGLIDKNTLAFYGDLTYYAYGKEVMNFLKKHNVVPVFLRKGKLIDRGSIFVI